MPTEAWARHPDPAIHATESGQNYPLRTVAQLATIFAQNNPDSETLAMAKKGKSKKKLEVLYLVCEETGDYNYTIRRKSGGEKLKVKKYSPRLRKHTIHNEKKK